MKTEAAMGVTWPQASAGPSAASCGLRISWELVAGGWDWIALGVWAARQAADAGACVPGAAVSPPHAGRRAFGEPRDLCETQCAVGVTGRTDVSGLG